MAPRCTLEASINENTAKGLQESVVRERLTSINFEPVTTKHAEIAKIVMFDLRKQADLIKRAKIPIE